MLLLSGMPYKRHTYNVYESYYEISLDQLVKMSEARTLKITAANHPDDVPAYRGVTKGHQDLSAFAREVAKIAGMANASTR